MKKLYPENIFLTKNTTKLVLFACLLICGIYNSYSQVVVPFAPRTSLKTPTKTNYTIKGDFTMIGNTNMQLAGHNYPTNQHNGTDMEYVDIDGDPNTWNSSSAFLNFSEENGALQDCSNIIYAGLYWTGRAGRDSQNDTDTFQVTKNVPTGNTVKQQATSSLQIRDNQGVIENTNYSLDIVRSGNNNNRIITYVFTSSAAGNKIEFIYRYNDGTETLHVKTNNGSESLLLDDNINGHDIDSNDAYPNSPYIIFNNLNTTTKTGYSIEVTRLRRNGSNSTAESNNTRAYLTVTYFETVPEIIDITKNFDKRKVSIKGPLASGYTELQANGIHFPNTQYGKMFSAYAEVTDYVRANGIGNYFVADIALKEGRPDDTGYYGGWGMVIVYENSKMKWRDVTVFDGHAFVTNGVANHTVNVSGFNAVQNGPVNLKLGLMAGEGDINYKGDYFQIRRRNSNSYDNLSYSPSNESPNNAENFFNSVIRTGGNVRNPNYANNTGLDIVMFDVDNTGNRYINNNQTSTSFRYGSLQDTYIIFNMTFSVDAYVPEPEGVLTNTSINGNPNPPIPSLAPGDYADYKIEIKNKGTEALNNTIFTIPLPESVNPNDFDIVYNTYAPFSTGNIPTYNANLGPNGSIVWNLGTLPVAPNTDTVLADISFKLTATTNCAILSNPSIGSNISLSGIITGVGAISNVTVNTNLIQGYQTSGQCAGEPIPTPNVIQLDSENYINEPPTASNLPSLTVECLGNIPAPDVNVITDEIDNSGIAPIVAFVSDVSNNATNPEIITRTYSVTDDCGNAINITQIFTVQDVTAPTIICPADISIAASAGSCEASISIVAPTASDNCATTFTFTGTRSDNLALTAPYPTGTTTITWIANDGANNSLPCVQNIIVSDALPPATPTLADLIGECSVTATAPTTTDTCAGTITATTTDALTYTTQGTFVINWTFDDGNGNSITVSQNVIVNDTTDPIAPTLSDLTGECSLTATAPTTTDNCAGTITATTADALTYSNQGTFVINWTFDDGNGNSITVQQNVIVDDTTDPIAPTLVDLTGECSVTATAPTTTDTCAGTIVGTTTDPLTYSTQGNYIINWTFDDGNGNSITVQQNVVVDDTTDPIAPILADLTGECSVTATAPTTTDACVGTIVGTTTDPLTYSNQGTFVINWTFDDGNGNSITVSQNVVVDDTTDPIAPILADLTGECSVTATAPTTTDACAGTITATTADALTYSTQGTFVINWTFDDGNGNSIIVQQNVTVDDTIDPIAPTLSDLIGECSVTATAPTTTDNCAGTIVGITTDPLTYSTQGNYIINWTFDDGNGNSITVQQNVIVNDTIDPIAPTLSDLTGECSVTATVPTTTDACVGTITATTTDALTYSTQGNYTINWIFDDGNGNSITVSQNVIVDDTTAPVAPTLADLTGECSVTATAPTTTDNCAGTIVGTTTDPLTYSNQGTFVINWTFDDGNGNSITVPQNVIVDDTTDPIAPTLSDLTGECSVTATAPTTTDNCAGTIIATTTDPLTYSTQGTFVINWTFDDGNGNSITVPQNVIVDDTTDPIAPTLSDLIGECSVTATAPTTTDNCVGTITATTTDALTYSNQGTFVINWTFDDGNGNSITVSQNVVVDDTIDPIAPVLVDLTDECSVTATAPTTTDNCAGNIIATTTDPLTYSNQGTFVINWTFDDGNGNNITVQQNVIVDDTTDPIAPTLADLTGECSVTAIAPTTTDACAGNIIATTTDPLTYSTQGTYVINWTFDDNNGNSITVPQNIIVNDTTDPVAPTLADLIGECSVTVTAPTTTDACAGTITATTTDALTYSTLGNYTINWTFDDGNGNSITVSQNVIVDDTTNPVAPTLSDLTGECSVTATVPTIVDNCNGLIITATTTDPLTYSTQGTFVINWTFDDGNGNSITVSQNVIVDDTTNPVAPTLSDLTGECSVTATIPTTTDNCAGTITATTTDALTYSNQGNYIINWIFDDGNGNSITVSQNVIVNDTTDPIAPTLSDLTGECSVTATIPTTTDDCAGTITATTTDALTYSNQGNYIINWIFDDGNGNNITVQQNVIVDDTTDPVAPTLADLTGECSVTATVPTIVDNCNGSIITATTTDALTYSTQGTFVINWTFDDGNGNSIIVSQNVIVDDTTNPVAPTLSNLIGECSVTATAPTTTDDCAGTITATTTEALTYSTQGTFVINWIFDDGNGNSITVPQNVIVNDTTDPIEPTLSDLIGECSVTATAPTTTDVCAGTIIGTTTDPLTYSTQGTFIINWTFDDGNGNSITVSQNVIVNDTIDPIAPALTNLIGECSVTVTAPTTTDTCAGTITATTTDALTYTTQGTFIINWTFDDGNGNNITVQQNVIVDDTIDPIAPTLADLIGECSVTATVPTIVDNCNGSIITATTTDALTYSNQGNYIINWTFDDGNGNNITVQQNVIVDDTIDPIAPTLADLTGECSVMATAPTTTDACAGTITATTTDALTYSTQGNYIINWTFDDGNGNSITVQQNVIVDDTTDPIAPTLFDLTGECSVTATAPTTTDACAGTITGTTTDPLTYSTQGKFVVNWTFDDGNGNSIIVQQNVIVNDTIDPIAPTLSNLIGECSVTATAPTTTDACAGNITATTTDPLTYSNQGNYIINWTFSDGNGNSITVSQNVIVDDTTDPVAPTLSDLTGECSVTATVPTTTDACVGTITATTTDALTYSTQGNYTINWIFDDGNGNSITVSQNVIVDDTTAPVAPTLADLTGECSVTATAPTTTDACAGTITATTIDALTYTTQGTFVINWTFDDGNGNSITVQQNVIVDDTIDPIAPTLSNLTGECSVTATAPTTTDNCAGTITATTTDALTYSTQGTFVINWTFDDGNGNSITVPQNVIVNDVTKPIFVENLPIDTTVECDAIPVAETLTATDNCGIATVTFNEVRIDGNCISNYILERTWTATDFTGLTTIHTQAITVQDTTAPILQLPINATAECSADLSPNAMGTATATDNCDVNPSITFTDVTIQGSCTGNFSIIRTWTATDLCGNSVSADQTITVQDTTAPTFVEALPSNMTLECDAIPVAEILTATDNCGTATVTVNNVITAGSCANNYTIARTWTATDECGLTTVHTQTITVEDTKSPTFVEALPTDITVACDAIPIANTLTATDSCGISTVTITDVNKAGSCSNNYTIERTWTATDDCGLTTSHTQIITVQDTTAPAFVEALPSNITVACDAIPNAQTLTAIDSCGNATVSVQDVITDGECPNNYIIARTWTAIDECGLTTSHTQIITVEDTKAPIVTTHFDTVLNVSCTDVPEIPSLQFTDHCSGNVTVTYEETSTFDETEFVDYQIVRTWTTTDACGNAETFTQTINVTLDEVFNQITAEDRCYDDGAIDLNEYLSNANLNGTWELIEGNPIATLTGSVFNPTTLGFSQDFLPQSGGIDYVFRYTSLENGCVIVTELTMNINADCMVLPCGENDVVISKALTPNGDGRNESFDIMGIDLCGFEANVKIFNRWGALIYESDNYQTGEGQGSWTGRAQSSIGSAETAPNGTYYYIVTLKNSGLKPFTGPIYLGTK